VSDELLQSPHFRAKRCGQDTGWTGRYAESRGHEFDKRCANTYQIVTTSFADQTADVPYQLYENTRWRIVGIPATELPNQGFNESIGDRICFPASGSRRSSYFERHESDRVRNIDRCDVRHSGIRSLVHRWSRSTVRRDLDGRLFTRCQVLAEAATYRQVRLEAIRQESRGSRATRPTRCGNIADRQGNCSIRGIAVPRQMSSSPTIQAIHRGLQPIFPPGR